MLTLVMRDPYRSGFTMHVCVADHGLIRYRRYVLLPYNNFRPMKILVLSAVGLVAINIQDSPCALEKNYAGVDIAPAFGEIDSSLFLDSK